jgi:hypothetical protein
MIGVKNIFPECEADTLLVSLILQKGPAGHRKGITKIQTALRENDTNHFIIGVIDTDKFKKEERYKFIQEFEVIEDRLNEENLLILNKPGTNKYIIRIHPGFEKWIWDLAITCKINPVEYGFDSLDTLKKATKQMEVCENRAVKKFVNDVVSLNPSPIQTLRNWLIKAL